MRAVIKRRGAAAAKVSEDDVLRAIEKLRVLGGGWSALNVGGRVVVRSGSFVRSFIRSFIHSVVAPVPYSTVRRPRSRGARRSSRTDFSFPARTSAILSPTSTPHSSD